MRRTSEIEFKDDDNTLILKIILAGDHKSLFAEVNSDNKLIKTFNILNEATKTNCGVGPISNWEPSKLSWIKNKKYISKKKAIEIVGRFIKNMEKAIYELQKEILIGELSGIFNNNYNLHPLKWANTIRELDRKY